MKLHHAGIVIASGALKFLFSPIVSYQFKHNYLETVLLTAAGGMLGALVCYPLGSQIGKCLAKGRLKKRRKAIAEGREPKRMFTRTNRFIVKVKMKYGAKGFVFLFTPFLSVPLTALLAARYFHHDRRTLPLLLAAVAAWSFVLSAVWKFTG